MSTAQAPSPLTRVTGFARSLATPGTAVAGLAGWLIGGLVGAAILGGGYVLYKRSACPSDAQMKAYLADIASGKMPASESRALATKLDAAGCHVQSAAVAAAATLKGKGLLDGAMLRGLAKRLLDYGGPSKPGPAMDALPEPLHGEVWAVVNDSALRPHNLIGWKTSPARPGASVTWQKIHDAGYADAANEFIHIYLPDETTTLGGGDIVD